MKVMVRHEGVFWSAASATWTPSMGYWWALVDRLEYRGGVEWGYRASDVVTVL